MPEKQEFAHGDVSSFSQLIGLTFSDMDEGISHCSIEVKEPHLNPLGVVHGGVIYSLADTGMGGALYSTLDKNERCVTVEIKITYIRFVTSGSIKCTSKVVSKTKRLGFTEAEVHNAGDLIAKASGTFSILQTNRA
jgi:acyl-CoA thioesterase